MFKLEEGQHRFTEVNVLDEKEFNAHHAYEIVLAGTGEVLTTIPFQKGPVKESGRNGIFIEDLLQICRHRLLCFQGSPFSCRENALALTKIDEALHWLDHRTKDRQKRNVEGTSQK